MGPTLKSRPSHTNALGFFRRGVAVNQHVYLIQGKASLSSLHGEARRRNTKNAVGSSQACRSQLLGKALMSLEYIEYMSIQTILKYSRLTLAKKSNACIYQETTTCILRLHRTAVTFQAPHAKPRPASLAWCGEARWPISALTAQSPAWMWLKAVRTAAAVAARSGPRSSTWHQYNVRRDAALPLSPP